MANVPTFQSNPYGSFDPSQWTNPYSQFQNQALPWPSQFSGWPTDASGQPIQPQPGMTLNSSPAAPAAPASAGNPGQSAFNNAMIQSMRQNMLTSGFMGGQANGGGRGDAYSGYANNPEFGNLIHLQALNNAMQNQPGQAAPAAANPAGLSAQQYMQLRANPGPVATPGATVPQSASSAQPGAGVLQQFLANWRPAQSGPGSGFQQAFYRGLPRGFTGATGNSGGGTGDV